MMTTTPELNSHLSTSNPLKTKLERSAKRKQRITETLPASTNPKLELQRLVQAHVALTKSAVAIEHMASDRKNRTTGAVIPTRIPADVAARMLGNKKDPDGSMSVVALRREASKLETPMLRQLRQLPIYQLFLSKVYGVGPIVAAYLCSDISIHDRVDPQTQLLKALKPSGIRMFCGMAVINGRLVRRVAGEKNKYNASVRTRLFQMFSAMAKNAAKKVEGRPHGTTSKYLDIWQNIKHRELSSERVNVATNKWIDNTGVERGGARAHAHSKGWHKACDVFLEDLYIVWRAIEGLPVWPSYYAAKLGYEHGGRICVNAPKMLSVEEALAIVGDVGGTAASALIEVDAPSSGELDDEEAEEIENDE